MTELPPTNAVSADAEGELARLCEEISNRLRRQEPVDLDDYAARWPAHADELRQLLPAMRMMAGIQDDPEPTNATPLLPASMANETLGDFRILHEVGRGGMGVVYEAEQLSLRRRVALKVLPFAAVLDSRQLRRFQNEAQAAALLHHPQIVPVYGVGYDRGVHFYAMQLINGPTLADVIRQLRLQAGMDAEQAVPTVPAPPSIENSEARVAAAPAPGKVAEVDASSGVKAKALPSSTAPHGILSTSRDHRSWSFIRAAVQLGIDVAEAFAFAHQEGVLHRDIKPGNLLLGERGNVWVTDFGLARVESEPALTFTGDLIGTLRYMSPEQALGNRAVIDHRTDIYSLGATLYELLTLQPVFAGEDRQTLLRQVAFEEPQPPRTLERHLPVPLETVLLKSLAKDPHERYATADALAADLRRFLEQKPVLAKRPSLLDRGAKWALRNRYFMAVGTAGLLLAVITLAVANLLIWREQHKTQVALDAAVTARLKADAEGHRATNLANNLQRHLYVSSIRLIEQFADSQQRRYLSEQLVAVQNMSSETLTRGFEWHYWWQRCRNDTLFELTGHEQNVRGLAVSPSGRIFATCASNTVRLWDFESGKMLRELQTPGAEVRLLAVSPDERWLAAVVASAWDTILVWDLSAGQLAFDLGKLESRVRELHFAQEGTTLVFADDFDRIMAWDVTRRATTRTFSLSGPHGTGYAWCRDGRIIAAAGDDSWIRVRDLERDVEIAKIPQPPYLIMGMRFTPDEKQLAWVSSHGQVCIVDIYTQQRVKDFQLSAPKIACADFDGDCNKVVTIDDDDQMQVWDLRVGNCIATCDGIPASCCRFAGDGMTVIAVGTGGFVGLWQPFQQLPVNPQGHARETWSLAFSPDGRLLASGSDDETIRLWNVADGTEQRVLLGHKATVTEVAFSPDGTTLASASLDGTIRIWRVDDGHCITTLQGSETRYHSLAYSPDGKLLAYGGYGTTIWDIDAGRQVAKFIEEDQRRVNRLAFSPDGRTLAVASSSSRVTFLDPRNGRVVRVLKHSDQVWALDFSPDGDILVTGDKLGNLSLWNVANGKRIIEHRAHAGYVRDISFTRDGLTLASCGEDQLVRLWHAGTGDILCTLRGHAASVFTLAFSPEDNLLASGSYDGAIRFWHAEKRDQ